MFSKGNTRSAGFAKDRMKMLLISERINCSPQMIKMLRNDLLHSMKKYITVDEKQMVIQISQEPSILRVTIPVLGTKD